MGLLDFLFKPPQPRTWVEDVLRNGEKTSVKPYPSNESAFFVVCVSANVEYRQSLPRGTRKFTVRTLDPDTTARVGFAVGTVSGATPKGPYVPIDAPYSEDGIDTSMDLYVASDTAGVTVIVLAWS